MTEKPCAWIADKLICGKLACDKRGPCDGFEVSIGAIVGEAIRKRKGQLRTREDFIAAIDRVEATIVDRFKRWGWDAMGRASQRQFAEDLTREALGMPTLIEELSNTH